MTHCSSSQTRCSYGICDDDDAFDRAFLLAEQGDHRGAIAAFEGRQDLSALERFTRGNSYRELGDLGAARDDLRAAARGGVWEAWFNLALTQNDLGQEARALRSGRMGAAYGDPGAIAYCAVDAWDRGRHRESGLAGCGDRVKFWGKNKRLDAFC